ncbi:MAG: DegT/DnrJ/EryC1/StrS family aminotransferase [Deltaproteobacteria bacterium]|nr:DegT/DnrJ/EryC1/StrS family aminotransferase [Deltaproteobacteria bacterium]TLN00826.1 MAG: DegT/DnrJ/EryC1/StrS family aminotransferase [bacterium]
MKRVPFLDLSAQYAAIREEISSSLQEVFESVSFVGGPFVESFEKDFAIFCGCGNAIGTSNGTSALWMTLLSLGIGQGDEVITVPNTFIATAEAITFSGARPVFVDAEERSHTMNPVLLEKAITPKTKAVIPVHLFGQPADMDPIMEIARRHGLLVVEDACQAHGAQYKGKSAGTIGDAGCFSFYPGKNLGAYGEAGAVVTNNPDLAEKIKILRDHGQSRKYYHQVVGWNGRMDGLQGAVLSVKLKYLPAWNEARRKNAVLYSSLLSDVEEITLPSEMDYARHVYHLYVIRTPRRNDLKSYLADSGIECGIHYPVPVHLQQAYRHFGIVKGTFPVAEKCSEEFLSLPMYPELTGEQIGYVATELRKKLRLS